MAPHAHLLKTRSRRTVRHGKRGVQTAAAIFAILAMTGMVYLAAPFQRADQRTVDRRSMEGRKLAAAGVRSMEGEAGSLARSADPREIASSTQNGEQRLAGIRAPDTRHTAMDGISEKGPPDVRSESIAATKAHNAAVQQRAKVEAEAAFGAHIQRTRSVSRPPAKHFKDSTFGEPLAQTRQHNDSTGRTQPREDQSGGTSTNSPRSSVGSQQSSTAPMRTLVAMHPILMLLNSGGDTARLAFTADQLQNASKRYMVDVEVVEYVGSAAYDMGSILAVDKLPAVAFRPPHCVPAICGRPKVMTLGTRQPSSTGGPPHETSAAAVAEWAAAVKP